jgi:hypothetical protein
MQPTQLHSGSQPALDAPGSERLNPARSYQRHWPDEARDLGCLLMHQQCWCWGQDIRCPDGNLLLSYGFERSRPEHRSAGSSRYTLRLPSATVRLWGFGVVYEQGGVGAVYLNRYGFRPAYSALSFDEHTVWKPDDVIGFSLPESLNAVRAATALANSLLLWIAAYEEHVLRFPGLTYRRETLRNWHEPAILPQRVPEEWRNLARRAGQVVEEHKPDTPYGSSVHR